MKKRQCESMGGNAMYIPPLSFIYNKLYLISEHYNNNGKQLQRKEERPIILPKSFMVLPVFISLVDAKYVRREKIFQRGLVLYLYHNTITMFYWLLFSVTHEFS